jgi:hypothetical protein
LWTAQHDALAASRNDFAHHGGGVFGVGGRAAGGGGSLPTGGILPSGGGGFDATLRGGGTSFLSSPGFSLGIGAAAGSIFGGGSQLGQLGGLAGSFGGQALGGSIGALGAFGGPIGAIAGAIIGSVLPSLLSGTKRGSVTVGGLGGSLGITGSQGNSKSREAAASAGAGSLIDAIFRIADQLGGGVDASRGSVSFGVRKDSYIAQWDESGPFLIVTGAAVRVDAWTTTAGCNLWYALIRILPSRAFADTVYCVRNDA